MKKYFVLFIAVMNVCVAFSQNEKTVKQTQTIHLFFQNVVGDSVLQTGVDYSNAFGESFTIRAFKYYISNIQLQYANGESYKSNLTAHLVNEADSTTKQLIFTGPAGVITDFQFLLGVDSIINTCGIQTGDLDPAKGMYWIWNTGYIMAKLEGFSPVAKTPRRQFSYDIGGYKSDENAARKINLEVSRDSGVPTSSTFILKAEVLKWFYGAHNIKISEQPMCHEPGILAMDIADNYKTIFSIKKEK